MLFFFSFCSTHSVDMSFKISAVDQVSDYILDVCGDSTGHKVQTGTVPVRERFISYRTMRGVQWNNASFSAYRQCHLFQALFSVH